MLAINMHVSSSMIAWSFSKKYRFWMGCSGSLKKQGKKEGVDVCCKWSAWSEIEGWTKLQKQSHQSKKSKCYWTYKPQVLDLTAYYLMYIQKYTAPIQKKASPLLL